MDIQAYLNRLASAYGPSGDEGEIASMLKTELAAYGDVVVDPMHNVICSIQGSGRHILLDAHLDQIGMIVTGIDPQGFLKVAKAGGIDPRATLGQEVTVWGAKALPGIVSCQPPHLLNSTSYESNVPISDLSIDIGMSHEEAQSIVSLGDRVTFCARQVPLAGRRCAASFADNRSGVCVILLALKKWKEHGGQGHVTVLFSAQEEVGTRGATAAAFGIDAQESVVVDVSFAMTPDSKAAECGQLGSGPMIGIAPVLAKSVYRSLQELAETNQIPYQLEVMGETTGTNADVISISGSGIATGLVSIPLRYMHTPVETVELTDIEHAAQLLASYLLKGGSVNA